MRTIKIAGQNEPAWRCEAHTYFPPVTFQRIRSLDWGTPDRIERTVHGKTSYYLEVFLTGRILVCWTDSPVAGPTVSGIDTSAQVIELKTGDTIFCRITERKPNDKEQEFIHQERMIEANNAIAAGLHALHQKSKKKSEKPARPATPLREINDTILWHFQQKIMDELDTQLKSAPSASLFFTLYCRDRMTLAEMSRRHRWPYRTLKDRKATLEAFLKDNGDLTLAAFFVDRSIFGAAKRQLQDHRARNISPRALGDGGPAEE